MKKLLAILVLGLLWCNFSNAKVDWSKYNTVYLEPLPKKKGIENDLYNVWITDYNKFKKEFLSEVRDYCMDQMISDGGIHQITQDARCQYSALVDLTEKHKVYTKEFVTIMYSWHQNLFSMAKTTGIALSRRWNDEIINDYISRARKLEKRLFKDLDRTIQEKASRENVKYLAKKKKESEPKGPDIDDDEIISASSGSGFFASKEGHIITNFHVIENCDSIKINFKGKEVVSEIIAIDKMNDLAIIQANIKPLKIFPVSNKDVTILQDVIVAGYPLGKYLSSAIKMHKGSVTALSGYEDNYSNFQTDATINQGNSGGPIIDKNGNVVGVAVATWVEEGVQGIHFGIKSSVLRTFANAKELNFLPPNHGEISKEKLGELIAGATTYLECWMTGAKIKKMIAEADTKKAFFSKFKQ